MGLSAATGVGVLAAVASGSLVAGLGVAGVALKGADAIYESLAGSGHCGCEACEQGGTGLADDLAGLADELASTADALQTIAPEVRRKRPREPERARKGLQRLDRSQVAKRKWRVASDTPQARRRRGESGVTRTGRPRGECHGRAGMQGSATVARACRGVSRGGESTHRDTLLNRVSRCAVHQGTRVTPPVCTQSRVHPCVHRSGHV
eukprot:COSAG02_NODE_11_length_58539_cov_103.119473_34_plen_207_part_00